ncbi:MAG: histidine ammonia-lyase [Candidatus Hermodarchaeota archaeon]
MVSILLDGKNLDLPSIISVTCDKSEVGLSEEAKNKVLEARRIVESLIQQKKVVYGVSTGFGILCNTIIPQEKIDELQHNLILSHAAGVGDLLPEEIVRGIMLLRANSLCRGNSGIKLETIETLIEMLNKGVHPIIPEKGSLGASGDLAPLAHMSLVLLGQGEAIYQGNRLSGAEALEKAGITPVKLGAKEGLALINGTQLMTSFLAHSVHFAKSIVKIADIACAMTLDALKGSPDAFDEDIHILRPHRGQQDSAANLRKLTANSQLTGRSGRVQDPYSIRCAPQVHGASRDALNYVKKVTEIEINAVTDNPLIFPDKEPPSISGGNFHGQPLALAADFLGIALAELGNISERRVEHLLNPVLNSPLPPFLIEDSGLNSGLMLAQYTAAALVSENKLLASPASVDSIPTSANQEDHVSMGALAARKAYKILENLQYILAIELLCATQALDFSIQENKEPSPSVKKVWETVRSVVDFRSKDRLMHTDIEKIVELVRSQKLLEAVGDIDLR